MVTFRGYSIDKSSKTQLLITTKNQKKMMSSLKNTWKRNYLVLSVPPLKAGITCTQGPTSESMFRKTCAYTDCWQIYPRLEEKKPNQTVQTKLVAPVYICTLPLYIDPYDMHSPVLGSHLWIDVLENLSVYRLLTYLPKARIKKPNQTCSTRREKCTLSLYIYPYDMHSPVLGANQTKLES